MDDRGGQTDGVARWALHAIGVIVGALALLPLGYLIFRGAQLGADSAWAALGDRATLDAAGRSVGLAILVSTLAVVAALPMAWLTHATDMPMRRAMRLLLNLPLAVPSYVSAFVVIAVFGPSGFFVTHLGVRPPEVQGWFGVTLALIFVYPYALIPMQAALARLDPRVWEAGRSLGGTRRQMLTSVLGPHLWPAAAAGALVVALYTLSDFGAVSMFRFRCLSYIIYVRYGSPFGRAEAVWLGLLLAALAILLMVAYQRTRIRRASAGVSGTPRDWPVIALGRWRWPAFIYCALFVVYGVVLPIAVVSVWLFTGLAQGNPVGTLGGETMRTLGVGVAAAVITVGAASAPALLGRFGNPRVARWVRRASHTGYALPGIVVALALVFFATRVAMPLYQTVPLLLFAYTVRFLPLAVGTLGEGLDAQNPRLYDAARSLGASPAAAWRRVVLPVAKPVFWAGWLAVFLSTIKELPTTLLLAPPGFSTLATRVWHLTLDAYFTAAAPTVLILLALALIALRLRPDERPRATTRVDP